MKALVARFVKDDQGQDLIEYALLGTFVALAAYVGADILGQGLNNWYDDLGTEVDSIAVPDLSGS